MSLTHDDKKKNNQMIDHELGTCDLNAGCSGARGPVTVHRAVGRHSLISDTQVTEFTASSVSCATCAWPGP